MDNLIFKYEDIFKENDDDTLTMIIPDEIAKFMNLEKGDSITLTVTENGYLELTKE